MTDQLVISRILIVMSFRFLWGAFHTYIKASCSLSSSSCHQFIHSLSDYLGTVSILSLWRKKYTRWLKAIIMAIKSFVAAFLAAPCLFVNAYPGIHRRTDYASVPPCTYPYTSFDYVGCFTDSQNPFTLSFNPDLDSKSVTVELCTASCKGILCSMTNWSSMQQLKPLQPMASATPGSSTTDNAAVGIASLGHSLHKINVHSPAMGTILKSAEAQITCRST